MAVVVGGSSATPGVRQLSTLKNEVARYVLAPDDEEALAVAKDGINDAIRRLNTKPWEWAIQYQDITLAADTSEYDFAARFLAPRVTELLDSSSVVKATNLEWHDPKTFNAYYTDRESAGTPQAYTVRAAHEEAQIVLDKPPDSSYRSSYPTLRLWYYQRLPYLEQDADVLDAPSEVESFVAWWAKAYVSAIFDPQKANYADGKALDAWRMLIRSNHTIQDTDWSES